VPPSAEKQVLDRTRQLLKNRTSTLVVAWATAAVMWGAHFWIRRRVQVSGL